MPKEQLGCLMFEFKEEGNAHFKDKTYNEAYDHYSCALMVGKIVENHPDLDLDKELLSTVFSNKAACCNKMDKYKECIENCDYAIHVNEDNIKAYYRKASAQKNLKQYDDAFTTAMKGIAVGEKMGKKIDDFRDLIKEIESYMNPSTGHSNVSVRSNVTMDPSASLFSDFTTPLTGTHFSESSGPGPVGSRLNSYMQNQTEGDPPKVSVSVGDIKVPKVSDVDKTWLAGTNVNLEKPKAKNGKGKNKKGSKDKKNAKSNAYAGKFQYLQMLSSSDSSDQNNEDSEEDISLDTGLSQPTINPSLTSGSSSQRASHTGTPISDFGYGSEDSNVLIQGKKGRSMGLVSDYKGLDDFGLPPGMVLSNPEVEYVGARPPQLMDTVVQEPKPPQAANPQLAPGHARPQHNPAPYMPVPKPNIPAPPVVYPFDMKYDFRMACNICYEKFSAPANAYRYKSRYPHNCLHDILLVKKKESDDTECDWSRIRPRNKKIQFTGRYRLCDQFPNGDSCRVPELMCSFAHSPEEVHLWILDKNGDFDIEEFIETHRVHYNKVGEAMKKYKLQMQQMEENLMHLPVKHQHPNIPRKGLLGDSPGDGPPQLVNQGNGKITMISQKPNTMASNVVPKLEFPLKDTHYFKLTCEVCLKPTRELGVYAISDETHSCYETILAIQPKGERYWTKIRERKYHRSFIGEYIMCRNFINKPPNPCLVGEDLCSFAHNHEEKYLWTLEKDTEFNLQTFIHQNRANPNKGLDVEELFRRHPGLFKYICLTCYHGKPPRISVESKGGLMCSVAGHDWEENKLLIHHASNGMITAIEERPFLHDNAFFLPCHKMQFCAKRAVGECKFSHSIVEKDVWLVERDTGIDRDTLVEKSSEYLPANGVAPPVATIVKDPTTLNMAQQSMSPFQAEDKGPDACPYRIIEICELCWNKGARSTQNGTKDRCTGSGMGHTFSINKMCLLVPQNKVIRPLPQKIPKAGYVMCTHVKAKRKCEYFKNRGGNCHYAHSQEELDVWTWQARNNVLTSDALVAESKKSHDSAMQSKKIEKGESVINVKPSTVPQVNMGAPPIGGFTDLSLNAYYCHYCTVSCNSQKQWDQHCASSKHMFNLESDKEHQWNYRQPPWGVPSGSYRLCRKHMEGKCRYTGSSNMCKFAHSQEELDEWRERWEWRQMKREIAKKEKVYSYMESLLDDFENASCGSTVMVEEKDGIDISCPTDLVLYRQDKGSKVNWIFDVKVTNGKPLEKVALLQNKDRLHFSLQTKDVQDRNCQIATGDTFLKSSTHGIQMYRVEVIFVGGMFGSFLQWVAFDFGDRPVLVRKLNIELGQYHIQEKVKTLREKLSFDRWTSENREIVHFSPEGPNTSAFNAELQKLYRPPTSTDTIVTQESLAVELNVHNYIHKMHKHLQIEELTRHQIIASFNLKTSLECLDKISQETALICPRQGELFAKVPLNDQLSDDTNAGKLILTSVNNVLIAPQSSQDRRVYEAIFVTKENFDYDGKGKDYIYLCLSPSCNSALGLKPGLTIDVEIQFQMNRQTFCQMHYALDLLQDTCMGKVFPDYNKMQSLWNEKHPFDIKSDVLNEDQMKIIKHVLADRSGYIPPLIVYGPFGTGKTETLAQAAMVLVREKPHVKILICTHSNSAADLYITKHFDAFKNEFPSLKMMRVYYEDRRTVTVQRTIQKYCLFSEGGNTFRMPTKEDIMNNQIIITTLGTSLVLTKLGIRGCFTHMFVDEAAQAMECETIMPITLASEDTCVVLAGDYMQMSPKVYSPENQRQHMNCSLLERLYKHYDTLSYRLGSQNKLNVLLSTNYRTKMEILRFISAIFYGGPEKLISKSQQATCTDIVPLTFYSAQGIEVQDSDSTSYYNTAEIEEVTEGVYQLYTNWPEEWGPRRADQIGVVTPYKDQVSKIRLFLRRKKKELRDVVVERVMNVQGKEFRAIFISAVRTVHLAETKPNMPLEATECDGEVGDYGFLSDQKLLNTALTRAQSFVGVVGDPVALCAIGECMTIWRTFLKHCQNMKSIFPPSVTLDNVKSQVIQLTQSSYGSNLVQLADMTQEASENDASMPTQGQVQPASIVTPAMQAVSRPTLSQPSSPVKQNPMSMSSVVGPYQSTATPLNQFSVSLPSTSAVSSSLGLPKLGSLSLSNPQPLAPRLTMSALPQTNSKSVTNGLSLSSMLASDPRLGLHGFVQQPPPSVVEDEFLIDTLEQGGFFEEFSRNENVKIAMIINQIATEAHKEQQQLAMKSQASHYLMPEPLNYDKIKLRESNRQLFVSFSGKTMEDDMLGGMGDGQYEAFVAYTLPQLQGLLAQNSDIYQRAILHCRSSGQYYAKALAGKYAGQLIEIDSRYHCGQAFNNDEVVVSFIKNDVEDPSEDDGQIHGKVIGVLNRAIVPTNRIFLCVIEQENAGVMVPVDKDFSPIYNLMAESNLEKSKKGQVSVYTFTASGSIKFHHFEPVDLTNPSEKLFLVKYLNWDAKFFYPIGVVVGVLPPGTNIENAIKILDLEYDIKHSFKEETIVEIEHLYPDGYNLPNVGLEQRTDLRDKVIFTIDPPNAKTYENAYSVEPMDQMYLVGIHSADVTYFVANGGFIDKEARERGDTYCPHSYSPIQVLPERLSTDLCSLKPNEDKLTVSVFLTVNQDGDVVNVELRRSIINSKHCLKYSEVETIIKDAAPDIPLELRVGLLFLYKLSLFWSQKRIGNENICQFNDPVGKNYPNAHLLVEEVKANTNHYVALLLHQQYPHCTPMMVQNSPEIKVLQKWCDKHRNLAQYSVGLRKPFLPKGGVCLCKSTCACVQNMRGGVINVQREVWHRIRDALTGGPVRIEEIKNILLNSKLHPHLAMAKLELEEIQDQHGYVCSGTTDPALYEYYEMNITNFTHFTSPISRYMDLVVQHQITAAMEGKPCPYSHEEVIAIATSCTSAIQKSTEHEQDARLLNFSEKLQVNPLTLYPMVKTIDSDSIQLYFPNMEGMPASGCTIPFSVLGLADVPVVNKDANRATLVWQAKLCDAVNYESSGMGEDLVMLGSDNHVVKIPQEVWQVLMEGILTDNVQKMEEIAPVLNQLVTADAYPRQGNDVSCNRSVARFGTVLCGGSVTAVQLVRGLSKQGQLAPKIQLLSLSPSFDICIEHREDPIKCFAEPCKISASKQKYSDITDYQNVWRPVVSLEAVKKATLTSKAVTIHHVIIQWEERRNNVYGEFSLPQAFLRTRQIDFSSQSKLGDCLCIRYAGIKPKAQVAFGELDLYRTSIDNDGFKWVGHCKVTKVNKTPEEVTVAFTLHQSTVPFPAELLQPHSKYATIEFQPYEDLERKMLTTINDLNKGHISELPKNIALGQPPASLGENHIRMVDRLSKMDTPFNWKPNMLQDSTIHSALSKPFTLIQGPPGSGKTALAVRLAYLFTQINKVLTLEKTKNGIKPRVLMCAPTEKALDGIASLLKSLGDSCPKMVRVYSKETVEADFPFPGSQSVRLANTLIETVTPQHADIALHYKIRDGSTSLAVQIALIEQKFKQMAPGNITDNELKTYMDMISRAEVEELKNAEVVLCTCATSLSPSIALANNVQELIIDDANQITEPETMIPTVSCKPEQVVLLGDVHQLKPTVLSDRARILGLQCSLFERYSKNAVQLHMQYRMHEGITEFPSKYFYDNRLQCGKEEQLKPSQQKFWPQGKNKPMCFVHVAGKTENQFLPTQYGGEVSKRNTAEAAQAVKIATNLLRHYYVKAHDMVVLTQYAKQCAEIEQQLKQKGCEEIEVSTVANCKGNEWDYVILSCVSSLPQVYIEKSPSKTWQKKYLGQVIDGNEINVALTRARKGIIIIGNQYLLRCVPMWKKLLDFYQSHSKVSTVDEFMAK